MIASMCAYAQEHWAGEDMDVARREERLSATSYAVACFLAQNTHDGNLENVGVEFDVVLAELIEGQKTEAQWRRIIGGLVRNFGGLKKKGRRRGRV